jgi:hypothetical protein
MKTPLQLFIAIAILLATATVAAQVYKWVDKDGKVQYSDQPPPADAKEVKSAPRKVDIRSATGSAAAPAAPAPAAAAAPGKDAPKASEKDAPKTLADRNKDFEKRRKDEADSAKKADDEAKRAKANEERCDQATRYLRDLESGRPISSSDRDGNRKLLEDEERAKEMARARESMNQSCKK